MANFGRDVWCDTRLLPHMPAVSGGLVLRQALIRRLLTQAGSIEYWPDYGTDIRQFLLSGASLADIEGAVESECTKDDRVDTATATATRDANVLTLDISITPGDDEADFDFVLSIDELTQEIITT